MTAESVEWVRVHPVRTYEQVLTQIQDKILDGELRIGSRLPSERDLVEILGVSRSSVREALRSLETLGLIDSNGYSGRASGSVVSSRSSQALGKLLRLHVALADITVADLVDVRFQLEQTGVLVAAQSRSAPDINRLRELNEAMRSPSLIAAELDQLDSSFHVAIASASGNRLTAILVKTLCDAAGSNTASSGPEKWRSDAEDIAAEHDAIVTAIDSGETAGAALLLRKHIARSIATRPRDRKSSGRWAKADPNSIELIASSSDHID